MESQLRTTMPRTVYVTGGPGSGKGTNCAIMVTDLKYEHTSIGDLMRNEIKLGTPEGKAVEAIVKSGNLVPKEFTVELLLKTLSKLKARTVLIDGFPRSTEQAVYLEQITKPIDFILHFDTNREDILVNRLIERGKSSGRADDKEETIVYRFQVYKSESAPVVNLYDPFNIIRRVDCLAPINEVYQRAIRALRPEVFFIIGPLYSGKSSICKFVSSRYFLTWLSIESIKTIQKKGKKPFVLTDDLEIVTQVITVLQNLREEYRVIIEGFPENIAQAKHFARLIGEPNRVIYLRCSKDTAQQRLLQCDKHTSAYASPALVNKKYETFTSSIEAICAYYKQTLNKYYGEVLAEYSLDEVIRRVETLIIPEVIMARGEVCIEFLQYMQRQGYKLVNCVHLLELWRNARGLSNSLSQGNFSDDPELLPILRSLIFSGNGICKFVVYNFALRSEDLIKEFENEVCSINTGYFLCRQVPELPDKPSNFLYSIGKLRILNTAEICEKSFCRQIQEVEEKGKAWGIVVIGPAQSGKTTVAKYLSEQHGFVLMDYGQVFEEAKAFHSTEEDQRETVTFSELLLAIARFFEKFPQRTVVIDGLPPAEILTGPDGKYPAFPVISSEEEGYLVEEDLKTSEKLQIVLQRIEDFLSKIRILLRVQLEAPVEVIESRLKIKLEIPAEESLSAEGKRELVESWRVYENISINDCPVPNAIPSCITFNTSNQDISEVTSVLQKSFEKKVILVRGDHIVDEVISLFCWKNQLCYFDLSKILYNAADRLDELGEAVRKGHVDHTIKIALLKEAIQHKGLRDRVLVVGGYENDPELEFESGFEELVLFEKEIGEICMLLSVQPGAEDVEIEQLPVRKRKDLSVPKDSDDSKAQNNEDEEEEENQEKPEEIIEEEGETPMWNHNIRSGFCKNFHNFKGKRAELVEVNMIRQGSIHALLECMQKGLCGETRYNIQVLTDLVVEEVMQSELSMLKFPVGTVLRQELPLDTRELGNITKKAKEVLTNPNAAEVYQKVFIGLQCSFSVFWDTFQPFIEAEGWKATKDLRSVIKEKIDVNKNGFVSIEELNNFFNLWGNSDRKAEISIQSQSKIQKTGQFPESSLILTVQESTPDPATNAKTFLRGTQLEITSTGCKNSKRGQEDGHIYFGKSNKRARNDVEFSSADTRISFLHFEIRCKRKGYFLIDNGGKNGVKVRVADSPVQLLRDFIIKIHEHSFRISQIQAPPSRRDDSILTMFYKNYPPTPEGDGEITIEFISEKMKGIVMKFLGDKKRLLIGSSKESDIIIPGSDFLHAVIELRSIGWCLIDQYSSTGSFIYVSTWDRFSIGAPSRQLQICNLMHLVVPGTEFVAVVKQDLDNVVGVSENPLIRQDHFRRLYRMGKYARPGESYKEFECTHKPSRDKCLAQVVLAKLVTAEEIRKIEQLKKINSELIHKVLEIIEDGPYFYIVSEFLHGNDLYEALSLRSSISEETAASLFRNVLLCLNVLHCQGIAHGNVRPENFVSVNSTRDDSILKVTGVLRSVFKQDSQELEFSAPECLQGKCTTASDIWAAGVILYTMLTGTSPFKGTTDEETKAYIKRVSPSFKANLWEGVSAYPKLLLKSIFVKDPRQRPNCKTLLANNWLNYKVKFLDLSVPLSARTSKDLKNYACHKKLHQHLFLFISKLVSISQDRQCALETFRQLDVEMTGNLSRTEILSAFEYLHIELTEGELESIIREVDANMTGTVDYIEFLSAIGTKRKGFGLEKLETAFRNFEVDTVGFVTASELKKAVNSNWDEIIKQVESNEEGKIDIKELKNLMTTMVSSL